MTLGGDYAVGWLCGTVSAGGSMAESTREAFSNGVSVHVRRAWHGSQGWHAGGTVTVADAKENFAAWAGRLVFFANGFYLRAVRFDHIADRNLPPSLGQEFFRHPMR